MQHWHCFLTSAWLQMSIHVLVLFVICRSSSLLSLRWRCKCGILLVASPTGSEDVGFAVNVRALNLGVSVSWECFLTCVRDFPRRASILRREVSIFLVTYLWPFQILRWYRSYCLNILDIDLILLVIYWLIRSQVIMILISESVFVVHWDKLIRETLLDWRLALCCLIWTPHIFNIMVFDWWSCEFFILKRVRLIVDWSRSLSAWSSSTTWVS